MSDIDLEEVVLFKLTDEGLSYLKNTNDYSNFYDLIVMYESRDHEGYYEMNLHMFFYFFKDVLNTDKLKKYIIV